MHRTKYHGYIEREFVFQPSETGKSIVVKIQWIPGGSDSGEYNIVDAWHQEDIDGIDKYPFNRSKRDWDIVLSELKEEEQ